MAIQLHSDWKLLLRKAWSIRFMAMAAVFGTGEAMLPLFTDAIPRNALALLTLISIAGGMWSRLIVQKDVSGQ